MKKDLILAFDSSAYTTSIAVTRDYDILLDERRVLETKTGQRGLRQQDAVFQHMKNIPFLVESLSETVDINRIGLVVASSKPRDIVDSYMPVFLVGKEQAFIMSKILKIPLITYSHQEGHIGSVLNQLAGEEFGERFLAMHLSGGTSEVLACKKEAKSLSIDKLGGSLDLNFGQLIDRIGVRAGLKFPSGKELDRLSKKGKRIDFNYNISFKEDLFFNISGLENKFTKLIEDGYPLEDVSFTLFDMISNYLIKIIEELDRYMGCSNIIITGGVSANSHIRQKLRTSFKDRKIIFPDVELSTDNAVGLAFLARRLEGDIGE